MDRFLIPKDPRLTWSALLPRPRGPCPSPANSNRASHLYWARNALYHGVIALGLPPGAIILAPAYHCASAIDPLLQAGAQVRYYKVGQDGSIDLSDLEAKINGQTKALLVIHYFGFPQPISRLRALCQAGQLYLIEDCAHVLSGSTEDGPLGTFGDISVFSWRKLLPLYDGGQLLINNPSLAFCLPEKSASLLYRAKEAKGVVDKLAEESGSRAAHVISAVLRIPSTLIRTVSGWLGRTPEALVINNYGSSFDRTSVDVPMSQWSQRILSNVSIPTAVARRRSNYLELVKRLENLRAVTCFHPQLAGGVCPWVCPVTVPARRDFHVSLRRRGLPAATWGGVIHHTLPLEEFPDARDLYDHLVFLPVHQDLESEDLTLMVRIISEALADPTT